jgi:hypothetical protein
MRSSLCGLILHNDERVVRGPPARMPAAPDQPAAPTPPLPSPRNDRTRCHQPQTHPAPRAPTNNVTGNYRQEVRAAGGGGSCARIDAGARRARPSTAAAPQNHPRLGPAPTRARAPPRLNLPRGGGRGWAFSCRGGVRRRGASRRGLLHARVGEQRMAADSAARERRRARHPGSGRLCPASSAPSAALTSHGGSRQGGLDPARVAPHPTAPAISCPCNVTCSSTTGSGPRGRPSHRPGSAQVCGKPATQRVN